jgi:hypothetical protein
VEQFAGAPGVSFARWRWLRFFARLPDGRGALNSHYISHLQLPQFGTEVCVGSIAGIGQHHARRDASLTRTLDLVQGDFWFGLKLDRVGHAGLLAPFAVLYPSVRQVQAERYRHTGLFGGDRETHRYSAIILFADLAAILPCYPYRLAPLLGKSGVIDHPCHHRVTT